MARQRMVPFLFLFGVVVLVGYTLYSLRRADEFDRAFQGLVDDIAKRLTKAGEDKDLVPAYYLYLSGEAKQKVAALPKPGQDFQRILLQRLTQFLTQSGKLNEVDPLTSQSIETLRQMLQELIDIKECSLGGVGVKPRY